MSVKVFKCSSNGRPGSMYLRYEHEELTHVELAFNPPLKQDEWRWLRERLPVKLHQLCELQEGMQVGELQPKSVREKVILFAQFYKFYRGVPYQAKKEERANVKNVLVNDPLLRVFFESPLQDFSLSNYIKRINITRDIAANGRRDPAKAPMPSEYSRDYERTLSGEELTRYRAHLRSLGWRTINTQSGQVWTDQLPNQYDAAFEKQLGTLARERYHMHLKGIGYRCRTLPNGTLEWYETNY